MAAGEEGVEGLGIAHEHVTQAKLYPLLHIGCIIESRL